MLLSLCLHTLDSNLVQLIFLILYALILHALMKNIDNWFPPETLNILDDFSISNVENMPGVESYDFQMYCFREVNVLADHTTLTMT